MKLKKKIERLRRTMAEAKAAEMEEIYSTYPIVPILVNRCDYASQWFQGYEQALKDLEKWKGDKQ